MTRDHTDERSGESGTDAAVAPQTVLNFDSILAISGLAILTAVVWLPFGLWKTGLIEDWSFYSVLDGHLSARSALTMQSNRPFVMLGWAIGHWLTPNSFVGLNILHVVLMFAKGLLLFAIVRRLLPRANPLAFWAGALFMIYPADRDLFATRVTNYHIAVVFYLLATYCLLVYWQSGRRWIFVCAIAALILDLGTIEVSFPLVCVTPGILLLENHKWTKRFWRTVAAWYAVVCLFLLSAVFASVHGGSYQNGVLQAEQLTVAQRIGSALFHFRRAYYRTIIGVWREIAAGGYGTRLYLAIALITLVCAWALSAWLLRRTVVPDNAWRVALWTGAAGLAVIGLGFLVFLPLPHRSFDNHVFLFSSAGAAMFFAAMAWWLCSLGKIGRVAGTAFSGVIISVCVLGALILHAQEANQSLEEQSVLASLAKQMPKPPPPPSVVLVFDDSDALRVSVWHSLSSMEFIQAVAYLYNDPGLQVFFCHPDRAVWGIANEGCRLGPDGAEIIWGGQPAHTYAYNQIVAFDYDASSGGLRLLEHLPHDADARGAVAYDPHRLIDPHAPPPPRVHSLLVSWPFKPKLLSQSAADNVYFDFKRVPGVGWWEPYQGVAWTSGNKSRIRVMLKEGSDYILQFRIAATLAPGTWDHLSVDANGQPVPLSWKADRAGGRVYTGRIDARAIDSGAGVTDVTFSVPQVFTPKQLGINGDTRETGMGFNWIRLSRVSRL